MVGRDLADQPRQLSRAGYFIAVHANYHVALLQARGLGGRTIDYALDADALDLAKAEFGKVILCDLLGLHAEIAAIAIEGPREPLNGTGLPISLIFGRLGVSDACTDQNKQNKSKRFTYHINLHIYPFFYEPVVNCGLSLIFCCT